MASRLQEISSAGLPSPLTTMWPNALYLASLLSGRAVVFIAAASERNSGVEPSNAAARLNGEFGEPACAGLILECGALASTPSEVERRVAGRWARDELEVYI